MVHLFMLEIMKTLPGECSSGMSTACKQAYLVVLTVNVMVVFFCFYDVFGLFFFLSCLHTAGESSTDLLAGRASYKVGANTY